MLVWSMWHCFQVSSLCLHICKQQMIRAADGLREPLCSLENGKEGQLTEKGHCPALEMTNTFHKVILSKPAASWVLHHPETCLCVPRRVHSCTLPGQEQKQDLQLTETFGKSLQDPYRKTDISSSGSLKMCLWTQAVLVAKINLLVIPSTTL